MIRGALLALLLLTSAPTQAEAEAYQPLTPTADRRGEEQTFLTFPEWFLVHSPAEYANYVQDHTPTRFPFIAHIHQFWSSYGAVCDEIRDRYPPNPGYHLMIVVIGTSTTVEYAIRAVYEKLVGRMSALAMTHGLSAEDRYGAHAAQEYVDFIRERPWYEFDFVARLRGLWADVPLTGPDMLRKWERRYALSTEYLVKAGYGWLITYATHATYEQPLLSTVAQLDRMPSPDAASRALLGVIATQEDGSVLARLPRYEGFTRSTRLLAADGVQFREIAGNRDALLVSVLATGRWTPPAETRLLFRQPVITRPGTSRYALVLSPAALSGLVAKVCNDGAVLEHVYDY